MNFIEFCEETALKLTPKIRTSLFLQGSIEGFVPASTDSQSDSSRCKMWHVLWLVLCSWAKATWQQIQANSHANANACPHALVQPSTCSSDRTARDTETLERTSRFFFFYVRVHRRKTWNGEFTHERLLHKLARSIIQVEGGDVWSSDVQHVTALMNEQPSRYSVVFVLYIFSDVVIIVLVVAPFMWGHFF